jgi:hypothetical protein
MTNNTAHPLPTVAELIKLAIAESDFIGDLDHATLAANAENSIDLICELWEEAHGVSVPLRTVVAARRALFERGWVILCRREMEAADALADGIEAGDLDAAGNAIPYDQYRRV